MVRKVYVSSAGGRRPHTGCSESYHTLQQRADLKIATCNASDRCVKPSRFRRGRRNDAEHRGDQLRDPVERESCVLCDVTDRIEHDIRRIQSGKVPLIGLRTVTVVVICCFIHSDERSNPLEQHYDL